MQPRRQTQAAFGDSLPIEHVVVIVAAPQSQLFVIRVQPHGKPRIFISHGINDDILPIARCRRAIAAAMKKNGYDVTFREFDGGHEVPPDIVNEAMKWLTAR